MPRNNINIEIFAAHIAAGKSGEEAAQLAGSDKSGNTARQYAFRLLKRADVQALIQQYVDGVTKRTVWNAARVLERLGEIVDADIAEIYAEDGSLKPLKEWPKYWRRLVTRIESEQKFERSKDGGDQSWDPAAKLLKIHIGERLKALELIGRHKAVDAFVQQKQQTDINVTIVTAEKARQIIAAKQRLAKVVEVTEVTSPR